MQELNNMQMCLKSTPSVIQPYNVDFIIINTFQSKI